MAAARAAPAVTLRRWAPRSHAPAPTSACFPRTRAPAVGRPAVARPAVARPAVAWQRKPAARSSVQAAAASTQAAEASGDATAGAAAAAPAAAAAAATAGAAGTLEAAAAVPFVDAASGAPMAFPSASGVYAVFDPEGTLQYMGLSRRLNASLAIHLSELPELCGSVKLLEVSAPEKSVLIDAWKQWMEEHVSSAGAPPPGNASGNTTWTTRKAKRSNKPEIRLTPGKNTQLNVPLTQLIDKVVRENKVVAFIKGTRTSPECGFSHRVLTLLNESNADYELLNVLDEEHNPGLREAVKEYSQWPTIPQVYVGGEFLGGADIMDQMAESGELKSILARYR